VLNILTCEEFTIAVSVCELITGTVNGPSILSDECNFYPQITFNSSVMGNLEILTLVTLVILIKSGM
jgi:hypothetical protein